MVSLPVSMVSLSDTLGLLKATELMIGSVLGRLRSIDCGVPLLLLAHAVAPFDVEDSHSIANGGLLRWLRLSPSS